MNTTVSTTESSFEQQVLQSAVPVIVDFWAPWCGPCKAVAPVLEEILADAGSSLAVVKVNADDEPELTARYNVRSVPTLVFFQGGREIGRRVGLAGKAVVLAELKRAISESEL